MPVYYVATRKGPVLDEDAMQEYRSRAAAVFSKFEVTLRVTNGATQTLEGETPDGTVIMEFPDKEEALAWYNSPDYQAAIPFRNKAAHFDVYLVEGR